MTLKGNWILGSWVPGRQNWEGALRLHHSLVSHEDHQAGGPQYRLATERLDTEQAWGSPPRMILSFLPQPNYILETSVLVTTERMFCHMFLYFDVIRPTLWLWGRNTVPFAVHLEEACKLVVSLLVMLTLILTLMLTLVKDVFSHLSTDKKHFPLCN